MGVPPNGLFTMEKLKNKWMMTGGTPMTPETMAMKNTMPYRAEPRLVDGMVSVLQLEITIMPWIDHMKSPPKKTLNSHLFYFVFFIGGLLSYKLFMTL